MKGQMFIITMVFLTGLVVFVSQMLLSYSAVDVSDVPDRTGGFVIKEYVSIINDTLQSSRNCTDAVDNVRELHGFLERLVTEGYYSKITYDRKAEPRIDCDRFNDLSGSVPLFSADIDIMTGFTDVKGLYDFYRLFIVFPAEKTCKPDTGDVHWQELWCKSESPDEGPCKVVWGERIEDCGVCTDADPSNNPLQRESVEVIDPCQEGAGQCPTPRILWDTCSGSFQDYLIEVGCLGGAETEVVYDCNLHDEDNCRLFCNPVTVPLGEERCDDWTCGNGACIDSGIDWIKASHDCSSAGNWDGDDIPCDCDCGGYDIEESGPSNCGDGLDNDCDGGTDCADSGCSSVCT